MSSIPLPVLEHDLRAALARVLRGESLVVVDGSRRIAQITPLAQDESNEPPAGSLVDFFLRSPLRDSRLDLERDRAAQREGIEF
ncbi:MAG: hypothetical protein JWR15_283 [Prosthecobacter sp.]|nr:hypothetical protein [Prosthecobacter sp.]